MNISAQKKIPRVLFFVTAVVSVLVLLFGLVWFKFLKPSYAITDYPELTDYSDVTCDVFQNECTYTLNILLEDIYPSAEDSVYILNFYAFKKDIGEEKFSIEISEDKMSINEEYESFTLQNFVLTTDLKGNLKISALGEFPSYEETVLRDANEYLEQYIQQYENSDGESGETVISLLNINKGEETVRIEPIYSDTCVYELQLMQILNKDQSEIQERFTQCLNTINEGEYFISYCNNLEALNTIKGGYDLQGDIPSCSLSDIFPNGVPQSSGSVSVKDITPARMNIPFYNDFINSSKVSKLSDLMYLCNQNSSLCDDANSYYRYILSLISSGSIEATHENLCLLGNALTKDSEQYESDILTIFNILYHDDFLEDGTPGCNLFLRNLGSIDRYKNLAESIAVKNEYLYYTKESIDIWTSAHYGIYIDGSDTDVFTFTNMINILGD